MADVSFSFDPAAVAIASNAASDALSKITTKSAVWDTASDAASKAGIAVANASNALSKAGVASTAASDASSKAGLISDAASKATAALSKANVALSDASDAKSAASDAVSKVTALDGTVIKSVPGAGSFAVHDIRYTAAGELKYLRSSVAAS